MIRSGYTQLLNLLWRYGHFAGRDFAAVTGETVGIVSTGEYDEASEVWYGAEIVVDGERRRGIVSVGEDTVVPEPAVLRIVEGYVPPVLGTKDRLVPQIEYEIEGELAECYDNLRIGSGTYDCALLINTLDSLRRTDLYTKLLVDRLQRKTEEVMEMFISLQKDWSQTFHVMLMRSMGGNRNKETFMELGTLVTGTMISREKSSQDRVEALLLGTSGFIHAAPEKDAYTIKLEEEFRHLANKYSIIPLKPAEWDLKKIYPTNHPAVRLAEVAALLSKKEFMFDNMLGCRTSADVEKLFAAQASEYWDNHYKPGVVSKNSFPKRIGKGKARLIGLNLVAPIMFAYGKETGNETLCENALDLLTTIPAEKNEKLDGWYDRGCVAESGFESQALLQLGNEFCAEGACARCHIGRGEIKKTLERLSYTGNN